MERADGADMVRAEIKLPSGATVVVEGSQEEVQFVLNAYAGREGKAKASSEHSLLKRVQGQRSNAPKGLTALIRELKEEGFFSAKRSLKDVQEKLAEKGHIYPRTSLSPTLIDLIRRRELGRFKENDVWVYVSR